MIKMVVCSFYNALINDEEAIPTSTMLEIERLKKKGIIFSVCTNGLYQEVLDYNKDFPFIDYMISLNGSYVYDVERNRCLYKSKISLPNLKKINQYFDSQKIKYYTDNGVHNQITKDMEKDILKVEVELTDNEENIDTKKLNATISILERQNKRILEITSSKGNNFSGIDQISLKTGIPLKEILVIGANESDYSLMMNIANSYQMANSCEKIKKTKGKKTLSNNEKGVEKVLETL
jgi:hydroxymethylpyrimidine pyrophosphatase-like HAD family hydrolase